MPTPVCICIDVSWVYENPEEWVPVLSVVVVIGVIIAVALLCLILIGRVIAASYAFTRAELRKSKDDDEKPKRKPKNDDAWYDESLSWYTDEDGEIVFKDFEFDDLGRTYHKQEDVNSEPR